MAMFEFTLLFLSVYCVGCTAAQVEPLPVVGNVIKKNVSTDADTNSSVTDIQPPPLLEKRNARLEDLKANLVKVFKKNIKVAMDSNSSETEIQPPPLVEQLDAKLSDMKAYLANVKKENISTATDTNSSDTDMQPPPLVEELDAKMTDLIVKHKRLAKKNVLRSTDVRKVIEVVNFLSHGLDSVDMLRGMADKMYCLRGEQVPRDCQEVYDRGQRISGVNKVSPDGVQKFDVYCELEVDDGGWTVIQRREDGSVDFYRGWDDYKNGFGDPKGEYWLGMENIGLLTANLDQELRVDMTLKKDNAFALYSHFSIGDEDQYYKLNVTGYSGTAGDSLRYHNGQSFSTKDQDHDSVSLNCATRFSGAWWYRGCYHSNLNGVYDTRGSKGVVWGSWKNPLPVVRMMVKTKI